MSLKRVLFITAALCLAIRAEVISPGKSLDGVDAFVERAMAEMKVPGAAVGVIHDGKVVLAKGYGLRKAGTVERVTSDTVFATGSVTKSFTGVSVAAVIDDGKLEWDKPVREYLPWFRMYDPVATELITVRDMLTHRSGLPRHDFIRFSTPIDRAELMRRLRFLEPNRTFRDVYQYNNLMFVAAGFLSQELSGQLWETLVEKRVFEPIGMANSSIRVTDMQKSADFASPHEIADGKAAPVEFYDYQRFGIGPNGAVNSTVNDLLRYAQFHLDKGRVGGRQVISARQMEQLHKPVIASGPASGYSIGWQEEYYRGHRVTQHGGAITGFTAQVLLFPEEKLGVVVLNNLGSQLPQVVGYSLADRLLGLSQEDKLANWKRGVERGRGNAAAAAKRMEEQRVPDTKPSLELAKYAGSYTHPAYGRIAIEQSGDALKAVFPALSVTMKHYHFDTFEFSGSLAQFQLDDKGKVARVLLPLEPAVKPFVFERVE